MSNKKDNGLFEDKDLAVFEAVQRRREVIVNDYFRSRKPDAIDPEAEKMMLGALKDMENQHIQRIRLRIAGKTVDNEEVNTRLLAEALKGAKRIKPNVAKVISGKKKHAIPDEYLELADSVPGENVQLEDVNPTKHHYED